MLPFEYIEGFLNFLKRNDDVIEVITYDDLPWEDDYDYDSRYSKEYENWKEQLASGERSRNKIYVLLQQDMDSAPDRNMDVMRAQAKAGVPSTFMFFTDQVNRKKLEKEGIVEFLEYPLDIDEMKRLEKEQGFLFCYHSNAFEKALFDRNKAFKIFENDVKRLRGNFKVDYFSAHGGCRGPNGEINRDLEIPQSLRNNIRWVHNGGTPRFAASYSDGGWGSQRYGLQDRDLRTFVARWQRGKRYRVLTHPQYYRTPWIPALFYVGQPWYDEILDYTEKNPGKSVWEYFKLEV